MNFKKLITTGIMALAALASFAEPTVTDVVAKQRYPWNDLVDITCKVTGINGMGNRLYFAVAAVMGDSDNTRNLSHFWVVQDGTNSVDLAVHTNGSYRLIWDAKADLGQVTYDNMVVRVNLEAHRKVQLWERGPFWADTNIGAENPEDYGSYFWWGDTVGYKCENDKWVASNGSSSNFSFSDSNTPTYGKSTDTLKSEGWISTDEILVPMHDAAHVHWGGAWRMPTKQELDDLKNNCDWIWTTMNGVNGYVVKGKNAYASASIFLPCAGHVDGTSLYNAGSGSKYWSSVPHSDNIAWYLYFSSFGYNTDYRQLRHFGQTVRPLQGFTN